jgi:hypothetical protein
MLFCSLIETQTTMNVPISKYLTARKQKQSNYFGSCLFWKDEVFWRSEKVEAHIRLRCYSNLLGERSECLESQILVGCIYNHGYKSFRKYVTLFKKPNLTLMLGGNTKDVTSILYFIRLRNEIVYLQVYVYMNSRTRTSNKEESPIDYFDQNAQADSWSDDTIL